MSNQASYPYKTTGEIYCFECLNIYIFWKQTRIQRILHRLVVSIPWLQLARYFFMNGISIR
jgi:hypothetical protein